jgi:hypothetical protein
LASEVHVVGHVAAAPLHTKGEHAGVPAVPAAAFEHVPVPQVPHAPHAVLQHVPPTQLPLVHWSIAVHVVPLVPLATQLPPLHHAPGSQFASVVHDDWHTPLLHTPGVQLVPVPFTQLPTPLHD